jgi:CheY-like chemotaxis protein
MVFLQRSGYDGVEAATGLEAISQARVTRPDLIIMDLDMPAMTGDQATARLKADPSTRHIPVIVTTAFSYGSLVDRAITAGADEINTQVFRIEIASCRDAATFITRLPTARHPRDAPRPPAISDTWHQCEPIFWELSPPAAPFIRTRLHLFIRALKPCGIRPAV